MARYEVNQTVQLRYGGRETRVSGANISVFDASGKLENLFLKPDSAACLHNPFRTRPDGQIHFWIEAPEGQEKDVFIRIEAGSLAAETYKLTLSPDLETPLDSIL